MLLGSVGKWHNVSSPGMLSLVDSLVSWFREHLWLLLRYCAPRIISMSESPRCCHNRIVPESTCTATGHFTRPSCPESQQAMLAKIEVLLPATASANRSSQIMRYPLDRKRKRGLVQRDTAKKLRQQLGRLTMRPLR